MAKTGFRPNVNAFIAAIINNTGGTCIRVNGTEDHIHIQCLMPKDLSIEEILAKIKANSSKWFRVEHCQDFHWQDGYAAYSVSKSNLAAVENYIANQDENHHNVSAREELETLIKKHWSPEESDVSPMRGLGSLLVLNEGLKHPRYGGYAHRGL